MDCKTARLLLEYARPRSGEIDQTEAAALDEHLAACESCDQLVRAERRADEAVRKAMDRVDVPDQLHNRILARLKQERGHLRRRWVVYGIRAGIAAAAVLLLALGLWRWFQVRTAFPAEQLGTRAADWVIGPPDVQEVQASLKKQGASVEAADLNYSRLRWLFMTDVAGRPTPLLIFNKTSEDGSRPQHALVFLLADDQFDLNALPPDPQKKNTNAYEYKCATAVQQNGGKRSAYVVYYTGDDWDWLKRPLSPPATANGN